MGKRWRHYQIGPYRLGFLKGQAVATWTEGDGRRRERLGSADTEQAARALLAAFAEGKSALKSSSTLNVSTIFAAYAKDRALEGKLVDNLNYHWKALSPTFGPLAPSSITTDLCQDYTKSRLREGRSAGTVWTELTQLRSALNWAAKRRVLTAAPYIWIPQKPLPKERVLTPDEYDALLAGAVMPHVRLFIILALASAARSGAILDLLWSRVDMERGTINFKRLDPPNPLKKTVRKGRAIVPMNNWIRAALSEAHAGRLTDHVIEWNGEPVLCIRKGFEAARIRAGLADVTPHTLRHTAASWMDTAGIDMERIARYLGHSDPQVTRSTYAKADPESLAGAADVVQISTKRAQVQRTERG
jgi:integrase